MIDIKVTRSTDEGRGVIGRIDSIVEANNKLNQATEQAKVKDNQVIHTEVTEATTVVVDIVNKVAGGVETGVVFANGLMRGVENGVQKAAHDSWEAVKGFGEDTLDVMMGTGKALLTGMKWGAIGAAAVAATPFVLAEAVAVGLVELGQHGARGLAEVRAVTNNLLLRGVRAAAAAIEARALRGIGDEANRIVDVRGQHKGRVEAIRDKNLGIIVAKNVFKGRE